MSSGFGGYYSELGNLTSGSGNITLYEMCECRRCSEHELNNCTEEACAAIGGKNWTGSWMCGEHGCECRRCSEQELENCNQEMCAVIGASNWTDWTGSWMCSEHGCECRRCSALELDNCNQEMCAALEGEGWQAVWQCPVNSSNSSNNSNTLLSLQNSLLLANELDASNDAVWAERHVLAGHSGSVHSVAVSPDGTFVVTGGSDGTARIWDAATGEELHVLTGHTGAVYDVAVSPDGTFVVTGSMDQKVRMWDPATGAAGHVLST
jgi:hypothetical protein